MNPSLELGRSAILDANMMGKHILLELVHPVKAVVPMSGIAGIMGISWTSEKRQIDT
jgi:hypothetical protein